MIGTLRTWMWQTKQWLEAAAQKPTALWLLFGIAFLEASVFPIPPDVLLISIVLFHRRKAFVAALLCTLGSVLGGILGYGIGHGLMETVGMHIVRLYQAQESWDRVVQLYHGPVGEWFLLAAAFSPIPYKVATIAAGAVAMPIVPFVVLSALGRGARFFLVSTLLWWLGPPVERWLGRYFDWLALGFVGLLLVGVLVVQWIG